LITIISNSIVSATSASAFVSISTKRIHPSSSSLVLPTTTSSSRKGSSLKGRKLPVLLLSSNDDDDDDDDDTPASNELETMCMMNMANLCSKSSEECSTEMKEDLMTQLQIQTNIFHIRLFRFDKLLRGLKLKTTLVYDGDDDDDDDDDDYNHYDYGPIRVPMYDTQLMCLLNNAELSIQGKDGATTDSSRIQMIDDIQYHKNILSYRVFKMNELITKLSEIDHHHHHQSSSSSSSSIDIISLLDEIDSAIKIETLEKEQEVDSFLHAIENTLFAESEEDIESLLDEIGNGLFGAITKGENSRTEEEVLR